MIGALAGGIGGIPGSHATANDLNNGTVLTPGISDFFTKRENDNTSSGRPKAYLNWVLLDEQFRFVGASSGAEQVSPEADYHNPNSPNIVHHIKTDMPVTKNGYLYLFVSNETTNLDVFFDNLQVNHVKGTLLEETHYYAFGLRAAGISSSGIKSGYPKNKLWFNGNELQEKEFSDNSGLDAYDFDARIYDQQTGRFLQIDPESEQGGQESFTPYHFAFNNPILHNDPTGRFPGLGTLLKAAWDYTSGRIQGAVAVAAGGLTTQYQAAKTLYTLATNSQARQQVATGIKMMVNNPRASAKVLAKAVTEGVKTAVKQASDPKNLTAKNLGKVTGTMEGLVGTAMFGSGVPNVASKVATQAASNTRKDLNISRAIRPKTGQVIDPCDICKLYFLSLISKYALHSRDAQ